MLVLFSIQTLCCAINMNSGKHYIILNKPRQDVISYSQVGLDAGPSEVGRPFALPERASRAHGPVQNRSLSQKRWTFTLLSGK